MATSERVLIAPSVLSADFTRLGEELEGIATADFVHYDVMDGHFVPNLSFGPGVLKTIKGATGVPVDAHLMVSNPDDVMGQYLAAGADMVSFHLEATAHANRVVQAIHAAGAQAAIAICPATPICMLEDVVDDVDMVLLMSVNPGFGGQSFIPGTLRKLRQLRALMDAHGASPLVEVDGGVSAANADQVVEAGANVLVAGSAVFGKPDHARAVADIRSAGERGLAQRQAQA